MDHPRMLYRLGGAHDHDGDRYEHRVVESPEEEAACAGWFRTPAEAKAAGATPPPPAPRLPRRPRTPATLEPAHEEG